MCELSKPKSNVMPDHNMVINDVPALGCGMLVPGVAERGPGPWG